MPTMKDVAREAGVSLGTVSNVLNNRASVQPHNREKVMEAVQRLGFRSNMAARTLRTNTSHNIGLIIPSISNPFYPELARGVEDAANRLGMTVFLCNDDRNADKQRTYIQALLNKNVDGIILVKPRIPLSEVDEVCKTAGVVLVDVGAPVKAGYNVVNVDDEMGIVRGMELLYSFGHTRIAFVSGMLESLSSRIRYEAYVGFLKAHHIPLNHRYIIRGNYDSSGGRSAAGELLSLPEPPTAVFAANDLMAIGVMKVAQERGLQIPQQLSVIGYDNIETTNLCTPLLTTINQPKYEMGIASMEMLYSCINKGKKMQCGHALTLETSVVFRQSVGPAPA